MGGRTRQAPCGFALLTLALPFSTACGRQAIVQTESLPVQRVVVYRNGVAYFERSGHVDKEEVRFKMKQTEVGDFLATLAVMERGGSSVRAAAFPLKMDDDEQDADGPPPARTEDQKKGLETVVLSLDGKAHDLQVGYVAESPVWRPSYRLVVHPAGEADLQAWGIVENLSGEDWKNVKLSLIAGAPLAFRADLGTPVIPPRPTVTDEGEVIAAVPHGETSLAQDAPPPPPATVAAAPAPFAGAELEDGVGLGLVGGLGHGAGTGSGQGIGNGRGRLGGGGGARKVAAARIRMGEASVSPAQSPAAAPPAEPRPSVSPPRNLRSLAAIAVEGGATRYDLPLRVTIPDRSATMVMLLSRQVSGEALFLFAPDGGVPDSRNHPFRVGRFTNGTAGVLERGPIAVFEEGAFLGQGMLDPLPAGATATVPFALERSVAVDIDHDVDERGERVAKIENGELTIERDRVTQTKYRLRNGGDLPAKLLVKHPRIQGARLFAPAPGTEDNVGTGTALVPTTITAHGTVELVVDERATERQPCDWFSVIGDNAVKGYLADPKADRGVASKLSTAWIVRNDIVKKREERGRLERETNDLSRATEETRRNLRAIEKNKTAEALRQKLTARLAENAGRLDDINRRVVELDSKLSEAGVQFSEAIRDLHLVVPMTAPRG
jgi:hypothetical protein